MIQIMKISSAGKLILVDGINLKNLIK